MTLDKPTAPGIESGAGASANSTIRVVYIAAAPRSGTTILASLLGEVPGYFNAGEVRFLWRQIARSGRCGCGTQLTRCDVWSSILAGVVSDTDEQSVESLVDAGMAHSLIRTLPRDLVRRHLLGSQRPSLHRYMAQTLPVYGAIAAARRSPIIVDSSKSPSYAYLLADSPRIKVHLLHLVRDPRAVVYSSLRELGGTKSMSSRTRSTLYWAAKWTAWNLWLEMFVRPHAAAYTRVAYEDFTDAPYQHLCRMVASHGQDATHLPVTGHGSRIARLDTNHTLYGNGNRFQVGPVPIQADEEWRREMPPRDRALVTAVTWPLLLRYGFHRPRAEERLVKRPER